MVIDPGNNINTASSSTGKARQAATQRDTPVASNTAAPAGSSDNVSLSSVGQSMAKVEAEVLKTSEVDEAKVAEVKSALLSGRYSIDADSIAEKMLADDASYL